MVHKKAMKRFLLMTLFTVVIASQTGCFSVPHLVWSKEDVLARQITPDAPQAILIASRESEFKEEIITKIVENYQGQNVNIKIIGLSDVIAENPADYRAVLLINTCMSWDMDRKVHSFLKKYPDRDNIIVLTTSGDGGWLPKKKKRRFDAISSASEMTNVNTVAKEISNKIDQLLK